MIRNGRNRTSGRAALLLGALLLLRAWHDPLALGQAGTLAVRQGEVKLRHEGRAQVLKAPAAGVPVFAGDALHSGPGALAVITLPGGGEQDTIQLYGNSFVTLDAVSDTDARLSLGIGKALFRVFARPRPGTRFEVNTPAATIVVRGTEFIVGTDGATTYVLTLTGAVNLVPAARVEAPQAEAPQAEGRAVVVTRDTVSAARRNEAPLPPVRVSPDVRDRAVVEQGIGTLQSLDFKGGEKKTEGKESSQAEDAAKQVNDAQQTLKERSQDVPPTGGGAGSLHFKWDLAP